MGNPFFSWKPHTQFAERIEINIPEALSDLQVTPIRDVADALTYCGRYRRTTLRPSVKVRILLERFTDRDLFRQLTNMINHLERGGVVAFGVDDAKCWGATSSGPITYAGTTRLDTGPNLYKNFADASSSLNTLTGSTSAPYGDEIIIESPAPQAFREYHALYSVASRTTGDGIASTIDLDAMGSSVTGQRTRMDIDDPVHIRYSDFWPYCFLPAGNVGGALLVHDHRIAYTLDLELEYIIPDLDEQDVPPIIEIEPTQPNDSSWQPDETPDQGGWEMHIVDKTEYGDGLTTDAEKTWMDLPDYSDYT